MLQFLSSLQVKNIYCLIENFQNFAKDAIQIKISIRVLMKGSEKTQKLSPKEEVPSFSFICLSNFERK